MDSSHCLPLEGISFGKLRGCMGFFGFTRDGRYFILIISRCCQNTKVAVAMRVLLLCLLLIPAAVFNDDIDLLSTTKRDVKSAREPRDSAGLTCISTHNWLVHGYDNYCYAKSHGAQETLGECDLPFALDATTGDPELAEGQRNLAQVCNANDVNNQFVPVGNDNHSFGNGCTYLNDSSSSAIVSDCTTEDETDSELDKKDSVQSRSAIEGRNSSPVAVLMNDVHLPPIMENTVNNAQQPCNIHCMSNQLVCGNDDYCCATSHGFQEPLGMSLSTVSSDNTLGVPGLSKKESDQLNSRNVEDDSIQFDPTGSGDHSHARDHTNIGDSPASPTLSDHTPEDFTDSQLEEKDEVQNGEILSAVKELANYMYTEFTDKIHSVTDAQSWNILSTIKDTIYDYMQNMTRAFAEKVRSVIHEELYKLLDSVWEMIVTLTDTDTLLGKFSQAVANKIMTIGLIIICLLLDYIFWQFNLSILLILAIDGIIFLMFKIWGPAWVYSMFLHMVHCFWYFLSSVWTYPWILVIVIVLFLILSVVLRIVRCRQRRWRAQQLHTIEQTVLSLGERLSRMEERQADRVQHVHVTIEETARRAEESILLRKINSNMENMVNEIQQLKTITHSSNVNIATLTDEVQQLKTTVNGVHSSYGSLTEGMQQLQASVKGIHSSNGYLTDEVQQLKTTVNDLHNGSIATLTDEMQQLKATVNDLSNGSIATLTDEVQQLKTTVNGLSNGSIDTLTDEVQQLKATVNEVHLSGESIGTLTDEVEQLKGKLNEVHSMNATLTELVQQLKATAMSIHDTARSTVNRVPLDEVSSCHSCNTGQPSPRDDIPATAERIIWGTYKFTKVKEIKKTIVRLTSVPAGHMTITKKYSNPEEEYVMRWWFVVAAEESVLLKLQEEWHRVEEEQSYWKLKKRLPK